jgi:acyl carrier protein
MSNNDSDKVTDQILTCAAEARPATASVREYEAPRNDVEAGVAEILAEFLHMERVGIHDNFILLGGESLLAAQAAWQIQNRFRYEVTLRSILAGTVADIAAEILAANDQQA